MVSSSSYCVQAVDAETGLGVFATAAIPSGSLVFTELPFVAMQHSANKMAAVACAYCFKYFSAATQLAHLQHVLGGSAQYPAEGLACVCGERYCSEACRLSAWTEQHEALCVGTVAEGDPLMKFKLHALEIEGSGDSLLLAAQVFARLSRDEKFPITSFAGGRYSDVARRAETSDWETWLHAELKKSHGHLKRTRLGRAKPEMIGNFDNYDRLLGILDNNVVDVVGEVGNVFPEISDHPVVKQFMEEVYEEVMEGVFEDEEEISRKFPEFRGVGFYPTVARLNHACDANAEIRFHGRAIGVFAKSEISPGQEIRISYLGTNTGNFSASERRERLQDYGFLCRCRLCTRQTEA